MAFRVAAGVIGLLFLVQGIVWIVNPGSAADALGMPLLEGIGRSTQIGDFTSFFLTLGAACLLGTINSNATWLRAGAMLLVLAAAMRTLAWAFHDAAFATTFIVVELIAGGLLFFIASQFKRESSS